MVEPVDPGQGGIFDRFKGLPRLLAADQFGLVQADDGLGQGVVIGVADPAQRRGNTRLRQSFATTPRSR